VRFYCSVLGFILLFSGLAQSQAADSIVVYSGRSDKFVKPIARQFSQETGIRVILHSGKSVALLNKLRIEKDRTEADLFLSNDAGTLHKGSEFKLWDKLPNVVTKVIHSNYRAPDGTWIGLSARARVLVINKDKVKSESVSSVFQLAEPRFKGRLAITNSANESYIAGTTVYLMAKGRQAVEDWLKGMKDNVDGKVFNKHSKIVKTVASGKKDIGLVNHYYIYRHLTKWPDSPIRIVIPDQNKTDIGVAWNVAGIALVKHSKNKKLAIQFIQYLVSVQGQKMFADANKEYPTRKGVAANPSVPKINSFKVVDVPMEQLGKQRNATIDLIEKVGMP
jgi:iron(III) transport system substrate-binding protein